MFAIQPETAGGCIERDPAAPPGAADWLALAAAPTFALMALLTGLFGGAPDALCAALQGTSALSGMVPMYLLMSAFHAAPWVRLVARGRRPRGRRDGGACGLPDHNLWTKMRAPDRF